MKRTVTGRLLVFALVIGASFSLVADENGKDSIKWLPMPEGREPSTIAKWKAAILQFTQPIRDSLLGPPETLLIVGEFHRYDLDDAAESILPVAGATNSDGFLGAVLLSKERVAFRNAVKSNKGFDTIAAPSLQIPEGIQASIQSRESVDMNGTNALYGRSFELLSDVTRSGIYIRAVAEMTHPLTNVVDGAQVVSIGPVFQSALEGTVEDNGALVIWRPGSNGVGHLIMISPKILSPARAAPPNLGAGA